MYHSQINEYKYEVERLSKEQQDIKKKYYEAKRKSSAQAKMPLFPSK